LGQWRGRYPLYINGANLWGALQVATGARTSNPDTVRAGG